MSKKQAKKIVPALRFPEFQGSNEWEESPFEKVFIRLTGKNKDNNLNVLTISAQLGLVSQLEYFNKKVSAKDVSGYYLLHRGDFAYNKSYSKGYPMGAIKPLKKYDKGVVSTLYICFRVKSGNEALFFEQYFDSGIINSEIEKIAQEGGRAHGLLNVSVKEFFRDINLYIPSPKEQQKIADCLSSIDELITAHTQKLEALKAHKKGLMQQLFPAEGETVPKLRFPEFRGDWLRVDIQNLIDDGLIVGHLDGNHGSLYPRTEEFTAEGIPYISATNFENGEVDFSKTKKLPLVRAKQFKKGVAKNGDVLFAHNATVGPVAMLKTDLDFVILSTTVTFFRCDEIRLLGRFLLPSISSPYFIEQYSRIMSQSTRNQVPITAQRKFILHLPPTVNEQKKLARFLSSLDEIVIDQSQKIESLKAHKKGLMQKLFPSVDEVGVWVKL